MKDIQYSSANVRIRTYEGRLLDRAFFERLLSVERARDLYPILLETTYGDFIEESTSKHDFEKVLLLEQKRTFEQVYELAPVRGVVDIFSLKYDYHNLKVLVKSWYTKEDLSELIVPFGAFDLNTLKELVQTRAHKGVPQILIDCLEEVFSYIEDYEEVQGIDIIFDNYYWRHFLEVAEQSKDPSFIELSQRWIDMFNLSTILRSYLMGRKKGFMHAVMADGGTIPAAELVEQIHQSLDSLAAYLENTPYRRVGQLLIEEMKENQTLNHFDLLKDNFIMNYNKEKKIIPFGPSAILGYLYAKEIEIKNLRMIFIGKINKIPEEKLRSRVRDSYV